MVRMRRRPQRVEHARHRDSRPPDLTQAGMPLRSRGIGKAADPEAMKSRHATAGTAALRCRRPARERSAPFPAEMMFLVEDRRIAATRRRGKQ